MPRYFFHTHDADDEVGIELPDAHKAWEQAVMACSDMLSEADGELIPNSTLTMNVTDEAGEPIAQMRFSARAFVKL
ncbi:hypothetical protein [Aquamicrobium sp. LC103]|uniref:DUF6894 family protein n=1 Tax=Aquamicrobium sp. LC103 TaxID=1120658 RepID=UPI00063E8B7B|nr:hypothetical protein [Aquamicrobium sp. LC103]TKT79018.1 hypothetical protein XW59_008745 [Aquamicrobium sp. LC103]